MSGKHGYPPLFPAAICISLIVWAIVELALFCFKYA
jgi:hypothetical protein